MPTSRPGNKVALPVRKRALGFGYSSGSILADAVVAVLIVATLGVAIVAAISTSYASLDRYDRDMRTILTEIQNSYTATW